MATERKKGEKGESRSALVATRFDPRTKYLLEIAARAQQRSVANYIEWAVEESFARAQITGPDGKSMTIREAEAMEPGLWDVDDTDRLLNLAAKFPHLLSFTEQRLLKGWREVFALMNRKLAGSVADRALIRKYRGELGIAMLENSPEAAAKLLVDGDRDAFDVAVGWEEKPYVRKPKPSTPPELEPAPKTPAKKTVSKKAAGA